MVMEKLFRGTIRLQHNSAHWKYSLKCRLAYGWLSDFAGSNTVT